MNFRWKFVAPMLTHRRCTTAVSNGNFVFIIGGHDGAQILNTIETYDVERYNSLALLYINVGNIKFSVVIDCRLALGSWYC